LLLVVAAEVIEHNRMLLAEVLVDLDYFQLHQLQQVKLLQSQ
jgi:CO dehydrogenase/acetyl-CoA synthase delta subunit